MNEVLTIIKNRCSVRSFKEEHLPREMLEAIAVAGRNAPTGMNTRDRILTVVQRKDLIQALIAAMAKALDNANYDMYNPDAIILVSEIISESRNGHANAVCAMQNMMLAATSLGVGSVYINQLLDVGEDAGVVTVLRALGIPDTHRSWCNVALGFPAVRPEPKPKDDMIIDWYL